MSDKLETFHLLELVIKNIETVPHPVVPVVFNQNSPRPHVLFRIGKNHTIGLRKEAAEYFSDLANILFADSEQWQKRSLHSEFTNQLGDVLLNNFSQPDNHEVTQSDIDFVKQEMEKWLSQQNGERILYIPCILSPWYAGPFEIGPIRFIHLDDFIRLERPIDSQAFDFTFASLFAEMSKQHAHWVAIIAISDCTSGRSWEIGDLTVDVAIAGIQLMLPLWASHKMARMTARNHPRFRETVSMKNGAFSGGGSNEQPGLSFGTGMFEYCLHHNQDILLALKPRLEAFLSGEARLPKLEQAWVDAAYWFHEGLAEPLDTIAVPKLMTALEVLLRAEKAAGSKVRIVKAICSFYDRTRTQNINDSSTVTVDKFATSLVTDRSRILHGTWSTLTHSLRTTRPTLIGLVHDLLRRYILELDVYLARKDAIDDVDHFLDAVKARRFETEEAGA